MFCQRCESTRIAHVSAKCSDCCFVKMGERERDGYVPDDMNIGGGDYIDISVCLECGQMRGEWPLQETELESK